MHARYNTMTNSGRRTSKGRQKIEIKRIEKEAARLVSFSRRRAGLFKKANELSVLCGVEVAVVAFSPAGKPFSFGHPSVDAVVHRFASGAGGASVPPRRAPQESSAPMAVAREFGRELARLGEVLQGQKRRKQELEKAIAAVLGGASPSDGWLRVGLQRLQVDVLTRLQQLVMEDQTSSSNMAMDATAAAGGIGGLCAGYGHAMMDNRILAHPASYDFGQVLGFGQGFGYGQGFF